MRRTERMPRKPPRPPIERIEGEGFRQRGVRLRIAAKLAKTTAFRSRAQVVGVEAERTCEMFQRRGPVGPAAVHLGQRMVAGGRPGLIPRGLVEGRVGFLKDASCPSTDAASI